MYRVLEVKRTFETTASDFTQIEASIDKIKSTSPQDLFRKFFTDVTGNPLTPVQEKTLEEAVERTGGGSQ